MVTRPVGETYSKGDNSLNSGNVCVILDAKRKNWFSFNSYFKFTLGYKLSHTLFKVPTLPTKLATSQITSISSLSKRKPKLPDNLFSSWKSKLTKPAIISKSAWYLSASLNLKVNPLLKPTEVNVDDKSSTEGAVNSFERTPTNWDLKYLSLCLKFKP